jgi:hypothetical protein
MAVKTRRKRETGQWITVKETLGGQPPKPEDLWQASIRPCPLPKQQEIQNRYGKLEKVQVPVKVTDRSGKRRVVPSVRVQRVHNTETDWPAITRDIAAFAWLDSKNLFLLAEDEETVCAYAKLLKLPEGAVEVGQPFDLEGKLTDGIKRLLFEQDPALANFIAEEAMDMASAAFAREREREEELQGN